MQEMFLIYVEEGETFYMTNYVMMLGIKDWLRPVIWCNRLNKVVLKTTAAKLIYYDNINLTWPEVHSRFTRIY